MSNLGLMYEQGRGVMKDEEEAFKLYRKAAALGLEEAKKQLERLGKSP
jgi:TPR repeat protein